MFCTFDDFVTIDKILPDNVGGRCNGAQRVKKLHGKPQTYARIFLSHHLAACYPVAATGPEPCTKREKDKRYDKCASNHDNLLHTVLSRIHSHTVYCAANKDHHAAAPEIERYH